MSKTSFSVRAGQSMESVLERMEALEVLEDLDMDLVDGVLKVEFTDGTQIIINRQEPLEQLWLASPLGPAHYVFDEPSGSWRDEKTGEVLERTLERALSAKLGTDVALGD